MASQASLRGPNIILHSRQTILLDSWETLFGFLPPASTDSNGTYSLPPQSSSSAPYTATTPPLVDHSPRYYVVEPTLEATTTSTSTIEYRAIRALQTGIAHLTQQGRRPQFPPSLPTSLNLPDLSGNEDRSFRYFETIFESIIEPIVKSIYDAAGLGDTFVCLANPDLLESQQGDLTLVAQNSTMRTCVSVEFKSPKVLLKYAANSELGTGKSLDAQNRASGAKALAIKLCLQMHHAPDARFGLVFCSHAFLLAERFILEPHLSTPGPGEALLLSQPATTFDGSLQVIGGTPGDYSRPFSPAPLFALVIAFLCQRIPGFEIPVAPIPPEPTVLALSSHQEEDEDKNQGRDEGSDEANDPTFKSKYSEPSTPGPASSRPTRSRPSTTTTTYHVGNLDQEQPLNLVARWSEASLSITHRNLSTLSAPARLAHPVEFVAPPNSRPTPPGSNHDVDFIISFLATPPESPETTRRAFLSSDTGAFLKTPASMRFNLGDEIHLRPPSSAPPSLDITLESILGRGRTSQTWLASIGSSLPRVVVKIVSVIHAPSVARESLFYEFVLPSLDALKGLVPKYFGTFVGGNGGWFAIVLEDCGTRVSAGDEWPVEDVELMGKIRQARRTLRKAGIVHDDIRPANVLQASDGSIRIIDYGEVRLTD